MDEETYRKFLSRAKYVARKFGYAHEQEDIAHEVIKRFLEHPDCKSTVDQVVIDWLRQNGKFSRAGVPRIVLSECQSIDAPGNLSLARAKTKSDGLHDFERAIKFLEREHRIIVVLKYVWDFTEKEIGYCFGLTDGRISQRLTEIQKRISKTLPRDEESRQLLVRNLSGTQPPVASSEAKNFTQLPSSGKSQVEALLQQAKEIRTRVERLEAETLAKEESRKVESSHEEGFQEWLT